MTTPNRPLEHGETYTAIYVDGPFDGQTEQRPSIDGEYEDVVHQVAAVDTKEIIDIYRAVSSEVVGDDVQVTYRWDQRTSEAAPTPEDRDGGV